MNTPVKNEHTGKIAPNRKEKGFAAEYAVLVPDTSCDQKARFVKEGSIMRTVAQVRLYYSRGRTAYACVWINAASKGVHVSGGGRAAGYGYHKASTAMEAALNDAGVQLSEAIGGRGESAMRDALEAIALGLGFKRFHIHYSHA